MDLTVDSQGDLRNPNLHDGFVDGIQLLDARTARVSLREETGQRYVMELTGLEGLISNDFRQSNIIFTVWIVRGAPPDMATLDYFPAQNSVSQHPRSARIASAEASPGVSRRGEGLERAYLARWILALAMQIRLSAMTPRPTQRCMPSSPR
jgi:hypothetical protein